MSILCVYHKNCMDGKGAAAVVAKKHPGATFLPMNYGDELPHQLLGELTGVQLYIVDFSLPEHQMIKLGEACRKVIWIDHHKTVQEMGKKLGWEKLNWLLVDEEALARNIPMQAFHLKESGASLSWRVLFQHEPMPEILKYIRDRDLWTWELGFSREVSEALRVRFSGDEFKGLLDLDPRDLVGEGKRHWDKKMRQVDRNCERAYPVKLEGLRGMAVNAYEHISETGEQLSKDPDVDVTIIYWREKDKWVHSLRSQAPVDVSKIATKNGGGGHAQAAGFTGNKLHSALNA